MTAVERILAAASCGRVDRTPVAPVLLMQGAKALGVGLESYFGKPERIAEGQLRLLEKFDQDAVFAVPHIVQDVLPWGAGIDVHPDGPPSVNRMAIRRFEEIDDLRAPDAASHPYLAESLRAARELARRVKGERLVVGAVIGPFSLPTMLMGTGKFLSLLDEHRERYAAQLARLMDLMVEYSSRWARAQLDAGCDLVVFAEGISSASIIGEDLFLRDALPTAKRFLSGVGKGLIGFEWVGYGLPYMRHLNGLGLAAVLVGEHEPLGEARRRLGPAGALMGNLNNLKLMRWTPERIEFEARRAIVEAGPGLILSNQGPEVPWETPDENIAALIRAARQPLRAAA